MRYLEKLRPVGRWENLLSLITLLSKLRSREIIFRGHCKPMFIFVFWILLEIFLPCTAVVGSLEKPEEEKRAAKESC